ncbi:MAG: hypothetical protein ABEK75_00505 [Salinibacter sp.]
MSNATVVLDRNGQYAFADPFSSNNNSYPRATSGNTTFAQGFMFGGKVKDGGGQLIRVGGSTYFSGMKPGGLKANGMPEDRTNNKAYHVWRVHRSWTNPSVPRESAAYRAGVKNPANVSDAKVAESRAQYKYDWLNWPADQGAPYEECNGQPGFQSNLETAEAVAGGASCRDENGNPNLSGDIPGRPGADQTLWTVANDIGSESLQNDNSSIYQSQEIGVEVQYTVWAYDRPPGSALGNIAFHNAEMIYAGKPDAHPRPTPPDAQIDSMFISWWVDPDIGTFSNDFVGSDPQKDLGYAYNAGPSDQNWEALGLPPAAVGFDFLKGPVINPTTGFPSDNPATGDTLNLSSFSFFAAGTVASDPELFNYAGSLQWFNLMRAVRPQPRYPASEPFINPITGEPALYANNGDPVTGQGWIDGEFIGPSDRRMVNTTGPFKMAVGDTVDVTVAQVNGQGTGYLSSISLVRFFDRTAQFTFDQNFNIPSPPASPAASASGLDEQIVLNWGSDADRVQRTETEYFQEPGFEFQGYRIYQLPSQTASLDEGERIATFDEDDGVRRLRTNVFNEESGTVEEQTVQILNDSGIQRHLTINRDAIRQQPVANGSNYYFAITAFGYLAEEGADVPNRLLESSPTRLSVRPQPPAPGTEGLPEVGEQLVATPGSGADPAEDSVSINIEVVDPPEVVDADYSITFGDSWNLLQADTTVVSDVPFGDSRIVNGLAVEVSSSDPTTIESGDQWTFSSTGTQEADKQQLKKEVKEIGVFPNPYRGFNKLEDSRFSRFVRFTNLPSPDEGTTTIRIFTLDGTPVRVLQHDSNSPNPNYEDWNLKNETGTFVASGLYLAHINTPFGDKVLKLALVIEEEILRSY